MTLSIGTGPFGPTPAGTLYVCDAGQGHSLYWEECARKVRVELGGTVVAESTRAQLLYETGRLPVYYFPTIDVRTDLLSPARHPVDRAGKGMATYWHVRVGDRVATRAAWSFDALVKDAPPLTGHVAFRWHRMDAWFEEDEQVFVHPSDPYHRVDVRPGSRHVVVHLNGRVLAESLHPMIVFETGLPPRFYLPAHDVRTGLLHHSTTRTRCPYKGEASYWSVDLEGTIHRDLVWSYPDPLPEVARIAGLFCFWNERVDLEVDGEAWQRPVTGFR